MANNIELLSARQAERDELLARIIDVLHTDERVVAAWLFGSMGRGDSDALSDLDMWVVVADGSISEVSSARREYVAQVGEPLLRQDAPQNAPQGGAYLLVLYGGEWGPHQVDWYWQPQSGASVPHDVQLLFSRADISPATPPPPPTVEERARLIQDSLDYFWAMCPIAAKKIARRQPWVALRLFSGLEYALEEVRWLTGSRSERPSYKDEYTMPPPVEPREQLAFLRGLALEMEALTPSVETAGSFVPREAIVQITHFFDLVDTMTSTGMGVLASA